MNKYECESFIEFWGGIESCKNLINSFNADGLCDERKAAIEKNYKISMIIEAVEFLENLDE